MIVASMILLTLSSTLPTDSVISQHSEVDSLVVRENRIPRLRKPDYSQNTEGRFLAVKTNIVPWAAGIANLGGEVQVGNRFSIDLPVWWSPYFISDKYALRTLALQPEFRYWLKRPGSGHFFGIHAGVAWYNLKYNDIRYQDINTPLLDGGISYGYSLRLNDYLNAEFSIGAGYVNMKYDRYYNIDNGAKIDARQTIYWGVDRLEISLVYHFNL